MTFYLFPSRYCSTIALLRPWLPASIGSRLLELFVTASFPFRSYLRLASRCLYHSVYHGVLLRRLYHGVSTTASPSRHISITKIADRRYPNGIIIRRKVRTGDTQRALSSSGEKYMGPLHQYISFLSNIFFMHRCFLVLRIPCIRDDLGRRRR